MVQKEQDGCDLMDALIKEGIYDDVMAKLVQKKSEREEAERVKSVPPASRNIKCRHCDGKGYVVQELPLCHECGKRHVDIVPGCDWVMGRRGWRQLGVYDG